MKNKTPRVFIDTNVWFSAFYGSATCQQIVKSHKEDKIKAVISQKVLQELTKNIKLKLQQAFPLLEILLLSAPPEIISDPLNLDKRITHFVEMKDQKIFCSAMIAKVDYFVTGNIKHFERKKLEKLTKIKILTPKETVSQFHLE